MAQYKAAGIDQKLVAASTVSTIKGAASFGSDVNTEVASDLGKRTSTVVVRTRPIVTLRDTPADRSGLLDRTSATSSFVEVALKSDKYAKLAIDPLDVEPAKQSSELGTAIGVASVEASNAEYLATLAAEGTVKYLGDTFTKAITADKVWDALVNETADELATYTNEFTAYVDARFWARLVSGAAVLRGAADPRTQALNLLGVTQLRIVPSAQMPEGVLVAVAHRNAVAHADVLTDLAQNREDADEILFYRTRFGTKVLVAGAVIVIRDGVEPTEG